MITEIHLDPEKWGQVEVQLQARFGKVPDLQTITYLIGHRELGMLRSKFTKEEKQELMHVGVCTLLSQAGYYELKYKDEEGWPHFDKVAGTPRLDGDMQDMLLKVMIIEYFENM
ncbi:MAG: hypothetical protein LC105_00650 [Chitinophagales bacterium]|nr:hypothetical protein [Chitinophagales bacterium]MCZ2392354.1 hypothetical protein [Chitinophagales bacterium]